MRKHQRFFIFIVIAGILLQAQSAFAVSGSDYTSSVLAERLQQIFEGHVGLYTDSDCTEEVVLPLGSRYDSETQYWIQNKETGTPLFGWQCYIYGNAAYNALFDEWVGHADALRHSERLPIPAGITRLSYMRFMLAGVRCGAYIRTTSNRDGSFNADNGHSIIVLSYNSSGITVLEGNADRKGLVRVITRSWDDFSNAIFSSRGRVLCHVVQPTKTYFEKLSTEPCRFCGEVHVGFSGHFIQVFHRIFALFK